MNRLANFMCRVGLYVRQAACMVFVLSLAIAIFSLAIGTVVGSYYLAVTEMGWVGGIVVTTAMWFILACLMVVDAD